MWTIERARGMRDDVAPVGDWSLAWRSLSNLRASSGRSSDLRLVGGREEGLADPDHRAEGGAP